MTAALNINRAPRLAPSPHRRSRLRLRGPSAYTTRGGSAGRGPAAAADPHPRSPGRDLTPAAPTAGRKRRSRPPALRAPLPPRHRGHNRAQADPCPTHGSASSQRHLSPRGPSAHRRLLTQLLSRPLPAATPGAAPPSRQLLLPPLPAPPSRSPPRPGAAAPAQSGGHRDALLERYPGSSRAATGREAGRERWRGQKRLEELAAPPAGAHAQWARGKVREAGGGGGHLRGPWGAGYPRPAEGAGGALAR